MQLEKQVLAVNSFDFAIRSGPGRDEIRDSRGHHLSSRVAGDSTSEYPAPTEDFPALQ
jgi:hypothetical protein